MKLEVEATEDGLVAFRGVDGEVSLYAPKQVEPLARRSEPWLRSRIVD
jgi:hypothetical protein